MPSRLPEARAVLLGAVADAGEGLAPSEWQEEQRATLEAGAELRTRAIRLLGGRCAAMFDQASASLALPEHAVPPVLGFGWRPALGVARLVGTSDAKLDEAVRLGALFNFGIAIFDRILDHHPDLAPQLLRRVGPEAVEAQLAGRAGLAASGNAGLDVLLALIVEFFA